MRSFAYIFIVLIAVFAAVSDADAYMFWGSRAVGMGTASVGYAADNNALQINPAGIAQMNWFSIDINYERKEFEYDQFPWYTPEATSKSQSHGPLATRITEPVASVAEGRETVDSWHFSVVDHKTVKFIAAGLYFTGDNFPSQAANENSGYKFGLGIAGDIADIVYIGGTGVYSQPVTDQSRFNMDFGVLVNAGDFVGVGISARNLFPGGYPFYVWEPTDLALGISGKIFKYAVLDLDITKRFVDVQKIYNSSNTFNFAFGVEGIAYKGLTLRGGAYWNLVEKANYYSMGIGYVAPQGSISYAFQGQMEDFRYSQTHSIQIGITF